MVWQRTSTVEHIPADPVAEVMAEVFNDFLAGASVELAYSPLGSDPPPVTPDAATAVVTGTGPKGWRLTLIVRLGDRIASLVEAGSTSLAEILAVLPGASLEAAEAFRPLRPAEDPLPLPAPMRRALRDSIAAEVLSRYLGARAGEPALNLIADTIDFLVELSSSRVESHDLNHGVVITGVLEDEPRLDFAYPADIRTAKRAPLLFDGQQSLLLVDLQGRARTELQRHRFDRLGATRTMPRNWTGEVVESGALVAEATRTLGGLGFFLRADRSIWTFIDGQPLLVRRGEHWQAFPFELAGSLHRMIGPSAAVAIVVQAAFLISAQPRGAILAIVDDPASLDAVVSLKDRYDLRNDIDPMAMRAETRLHHLIDAENLDEHTVARLAGLDGATVLDREGRLLAYGAVVVSADSQQEGARTAAARTLSETVLVVLMVSADGDITIFRGGRPITVLLGRATAP